eukprot:541622_1
MLVWVFLILWVAILVFLFVVVWEYAIAFLLGTIITLILTLGCVQKITGYKFMHLMMQAIFKMQEKAYRKSETWRISELLSRHEESNGKYADENKQDIILTRPTPMALLWDALNVKTFSHVSAKSPDELMSRINTVKKRLNFTGILPSLFPLTSCISEFFIQQSDTKKLRVCKYNWTGSNNNNGCIIHFHGGAFIGGKNELYDNYAAILSQLTGLTVYCVEWGTAPEYLHPSGVMDVIDAYKYILQNTNIPADKIYLSGDSAGGCIVLLALQKLGSNKINKKVTGDITIDVEDEKQNFSADSSLPPQPFGAILASPVCDLSMNNAYYDINDESDCMINKGYWYDVFRFGVGNIDKNGREVSGDTIDMKHGSISPLYGDFEGITTKLYFWVSLNETIFGEVEETINKCKQNNIDVEYEYNQWLFHVAVAVCPGTIPEARDSVVRMAQWIVRNRNMNRN